jgi:hypothetical protein
MKRTLLIVILLLLPGSVYPSTKFIRAQRPIENSYIVVLRHDAPALAAAAEHLAVNARGVLRTTYGGLAKAFWVEMSEVEALRMSEHPWVDWARGSAWALSAGPGVRALTHTESLAISSPRWQTSQVVAFLQTESAISSGVQIQDPGTGAYIPLLNLSDYSGQGVCQ